ncbi:MAG: glycosyltransferase family 2 protein [Phycisphaeraceae bacterium]|nr:glycosyltransferase family 2 protein [Phycisphaeraceae bacterium]
MKLSVIIINFRTPDLTAACLESLVPQLRQVGDANAILVENGSGDGSDTQLAQVISQRQWSDVVTLIVSPDNKGFAGGNNLGYQHCRDSEYILLLNSDTVVGDNCMAYCLDVMQQSPDIGLLSCRLDSPDGSVQITARKFPSPLRQIVNATNLSYRLPGLFGWADTEDNGWDRRTVKRDVEWLGGAFLFCRGDAVRELGLLDEDFFFYGEDIEISHRFARAGYRRHYDPAVGILHYGGGSSDPTRMAAKRRAAASWRARYMVQRKCYGPAAALLLRWVDLLSWGTRLLLLRLMGRGNEQSGREAGDVWTLLWKQKLADAE